MFLSASPSSLSGLFFFFGFYVCSFLCSVPGHVSTSRGEGGPWSTVGVPAGTTQSLEGLLAEAPVGLDNRRVSQAGNAGKPRCEFCIKEKACL